MEKYSLDSPRNTALVEGGSSAALEAISSNLSEGQARPSIPGKMSQQGNQPPNQANAFAAAIPVIRKALPLLCTSLNLLFQPDLLFQPCLFHVPFFPETQWLIVVLVSQGCLDKLLHMGWLTTTEVCFLTVLKASPNSRCSKANLSEGSGRDSFLVSCRFGGPSHSLACDSITLVTASAIT